jgi:hypothetical protein
MSLSAQLREVSPLPSGDQWHVSGNFVSGPPNDGRGSAGSGWAWDGNPVGSMYGACRIGETCPAISFTVAPVWWGSASPRPEAPAVHWSLDLTVFSYVDIPMTATVRQTGP